MKIATRNVERLKHYKELKNILSCIAAVDADILVLTETDSRLKPDYPYSLHSLPLKGCLQLPYRDEENRVSIYSKYPLVKQYKTYDPYTALCAELMTHMGELIVYGTVMGILGNRHRSFMQDLIKQTEDIFKLNKTGKGLCICGDFNRSFSDKYYFTIQGRKLLSRTFEDCNLDLLTYSPLECVEHIALSHSFTINQQIVIDEWNIDKLLSDHKGIAVELNMPK